AKTRPGSMMALALSYFASPDFRALKLSTQRAYRWIIERLCKDHGDKRADDPTREVRAIRVRTAGHHSWTDDEIAQFERHHAIGSRARLALALLLYTGQR